MRRKIIVSCCLLFALFISSPLFGDFIPMKTTTPTLKMTGMRINKIHANPLTMTGVRTELKWIPVDKPGDKFEDDMRETDEMEEMDDAAMGPPGARPGAKGATRGAEIR